MKKKIFKRKVMKIFEREKYIYIASYIALKKQWKDIYIYIYI